MENIDAAEIALSFFVVSIDHEPIALAAKIAGVADPRVLRGASSVSLLKARVMNLGTGEFEDAASTFCESLALLLVRLEDQVDLAKFERAEVRVTIFPNSSMNASVYLPRRLVDLVSSKGLDLYVAAL